MTDLQDTRANEPIMGRADVLFRFLQLIGKDRPHDVDTYLEQINVRDEDRPIVDQLVDTIIAGNKERYKKYEQARREVGSRNPYDSPEDQAEQHTYKWVLGFFLSKWIAFETAIRARAERVLGNYKAPLHQLLYELKLFSGNDMQVFDYVRKLRNDLVHGFRIQNEQYIIEAVKLLDDLLAKLQDNLPEDSREMMVSVLQDTTLPVSMTPVPLTPAAKEKEPITLRKMREEWDILHTDRRTFWEVLAQSYALHFRGTQGYPDTIEALVDLAPPPPGLPLPPQEHLRGYPSQYGRLLTEESALLHRFCNLVYPSKEPTRPLKDCSSIPHDSFDTFHAARGNLARFWGRWGQYVYLGGLIGLDTIVRSFDAQRRLLNLLSYLEISLTQWTQDPGVGKQWLFRLNRDWHRA